jgi:hypothetical protein
MESNDSSGDKLGLACSRRQFLKTSATSGVVALGVTAGLSSCTPPWQHNFSPLIPNWLQQLAVSVGAAQITRILNGGLRRFWPAWEPEVDVAVEEILVAEIFVADAYSGISGGRLSPRSFSTQAKHRFVPGGVGWGHPVPPVVMVQISQTRAGDPATDHLVAFVNTGRQHVVLKPWAWQTLLMFVHELTSGQSGAGLDVAKAGCALSLLPSGVRPITGQSPEGSVDWVTYKSRNGTVEISRVQESNSSATGVITASAIQDTTGQPLRMSFNLPT